MASTVCLPQVNWPGVSMGESVASTGWLLAYMGWSVASMG